MVHAKAQPGAWAALKQPQGESGVEDFTAGLFNPQSQSPQSIAGDIPHVQWASPASSANTIESPGDVLVRKQQQDVMDEDGHCRDKPAALCPRGMLTPSSPSLANPTCFWEQDSVLAIPAKACWRGPRALLVPLPDIT